MIQIGTEVTHSQFGKGIVARILSDNIHLGVQFDDDDMEKIIPSTSRHLLVAGKKPVREARPAAVSSTLSEEQITFLREHTIRITARLSNERSGLFCRRYRELTGEDPITQTTKHGWPLNTLVIYLNAEPPRLLFRGSRITKLRGAASSWAIYNNQLAWELFSLGFRTGASA